MNQKIYLSLKNNITVLTLLILQIKCSIIRQSEMVSHNMCAKMPIVRIDNYNTFYTGIDNYFSICFPDSQMDSIQVSASSGNISNLGCGQYSIHLERNESVCIKINKLGQPASLFWYKVRKTPKPVCKIGDLSSDSETVSVEKFRKQKGLLAIIEENPENFGSCDIESFVLDKISYDNRTESIINSGSRFLEVKYIVESAMPGDIFIFRDILSRCANSTTPEKTRSIFVKII